MKTNVTFAGWLMLLALSTFNLQPASVLAQGTTAFTYQGQLRDGGTNANGAYTMIFKLYDAVSSGSQIGSAITNSPILANGLFSANLDFGAGAFDGSARWLDITVQVGTNVSETLSPRVPVLPAPYAQFAAIAATVTNGAIMNAQLAANAVNTTNIASGQVVKTLNGLTDDVILSAGANAALFTNGNTLQWSATVPVAHRFNASNIFVVPTNVTRIMVELWGAGGNGGDAYSDDLGNTAGGGGGGGGAYAKGIFAVTPGESLIVTVGTGLVLGPDSGTSSVGTLISAAGGANGGDGSLSHNGAFGQGGQTATGNYLLKVEGNFGKNGGNSGDGGAAGLGGFGGSGGGGGQGATPGGGGGGGVPPAGFWGGQGADGKVIIYY